MLHCQTLVLDSIAHFIGPPGWWMATVLATATLLAVPVYLLIHRCSHIQLNEFTRIEGHIVGPGAAARPVFLSDGEGVCPLPVFRFSTTDGNLMEVNGQAAVLEGGRPMQIGGRRWYGVQVGDALILEGSWVHVARGENNYRTSAGERHFHILRMMRDTRGEQRRWSQAIALVALVVALGCGFIAYGLEQSQRCCGCWFGQSVSSPTVWPRGYHRGIAHGISTLNAVECLMAPADGLPIAILCRRTSGGKARCPRIVRRLPGYRG